MTYSLTYNEHQFMTRSFIELCESCTLNFIHMTKYVAIPWDNVSFLELPSPSPIDHKQNFFLKAFLCAAYQLEITFLCWRHGTYISW